MLGMRELFANRLGANASDLELVPVDPITESQWLVEEGDLMFGRRSLTLAGAGSCAIVPELDDARTFESSLIRVRLDREVGDPRFYYFFFKSIQGRSLMETIVEQVAVAGIRSSDLARLVIPSPPIDEQRRIAGVLGALDDLIDTNQRLVQQLYEVIAATTASRLANSSLTVRLSDTARFVNGKNFTKGADGLGRPVIRTPEVRVGPTASTVRSSADAADENIARPGDILFVWSGSLILGRWKWSEGLVNQHIFKVIPIEPYPDWLVFALVQHQLQWFLSLAADKATTMGHIQRRHLDEVVPMISNDEIRELGKTLRPMWEQALVSAQETDQLRRTRDELLPLLMSGAVSPGDVAVAS